MMEAIQLFSNAFNTAQVWLFETAVAPLMHVLGLAAFIEDGFDATEFFLLGVIEVLLLAVVLGTLEKWRPAQIERSAAAMWPDVFYTLLHRLGGFSLLLFFLLTPLTDALEAQLRLAGFERYSLDTLWPWLGQHAVLQLLVYLLILDFADYWIHRGQHQLNRWWALHALHHSQQYMTLWSDNRNHFLDDALRDGLLVLLSLAIGVEPAQFVLLVMATRIMQSLSHANVRLNFGPLKYLLVSPQFHRHHHAIGVGHEGRVGGCNFGVLFTIWDQLFRTADFSNVYLPTGIRDQLTGRDYGQSVFAQQWLGLKRLLNRA
jgi:sterol desaturase/sphingolipid hydroxylase (fatty acid hydroxylase superfamily)